MNFAFCFSLSCMPYSLTLCTAFSFFLLCFFCMPKKAGSTPRALHFLRTGVISLAIANFPLFLKTLYQVFASERLNSSALRRTATVMRNGCDILDHCYSKTCGLKCTNCRLTTGSRTLYEDVDCLHSVIHGSLCGLL